MLILHLTKTHPEIDIDKCKILKVEMFEEEKNWMCPYCDRKYLSSGKRREHIRKCHPNKYVISMSDSGLKTCIKGTSTDASDSRQSKCTGKRREKDAEDST